MSYEMEEKIRQDLDESGFLFDMKAKIRDAIYASLKSSQKEPITALKATPKEFESTIGTYACALVIDFMQQFNLNLSLKMLIPEAMIPNQDLTIKSIESMLGIKSAKNKPVLLEIVNKMFEVQDEEESGEGSIGEDIDDNETNESKEDVLVESAGTSQGYDQSVNSLAMEEFDYVEPVKKNKL